MSVRAAWFDQSRLTPDDPRPYSRIGPVSVHPHFVLVCDHASNAVPAHMERLGLDQAELDRHIGWDIGAAAVTGSLSAWLDAPAYLSGYSRLVVDCNRPVGSPTAMPTVSDGTVVPANQSISPEEATARTDAFFRPYHDAIAACLDRAIGFGAVPILVAVHSFTPVFEGFARPWEVGLLYEHDDRLVQPLKEALARAPPRAHHRRQRALRHRWSVRLFDSGAWTGARPAPYRDRAASGPDRHAGGCPGLGRDAGSRVQAGADGIDAARDREPDAAVSIPLLTPTLSSPAGRRGRVGAVQPYSGCGTILR